MKHHSLRELRAAPELVLVAVVQASLDALQASLRAQHGDIEDDPPPSRATTVIRAADVLDHLHALRHALELYRTAVLRVLRPPRLSHDDIPF